MKFNPMTRRLFLQGLGGAMFPIPFLPSLAPSRAWAQTAATPPKLICLHLNSGTTADMWFPSAAEADFTTLAPEYKAARLSALAAKYGQISPIFSDARLKSAANLINIYRGVDGSAFSGHTKTGSFTGHWTGDRTVDLLPMNASIDYLVSRSAKIYPAAPAFRHLNLGVMNSPDDWNGPSATFSNTGGVIGAVPAIVSVISAFDYVFKDFAGAAGAEGAAALAKLQARRKSVLDLVFGEYKSVLQSPRLSANEKQQLNIHVEKFRELEQKVAAVRPVACVPPAKPTTSMFYNWPARVLVGDHRDPRDISLALDLMVDILATAITCGLNNVATLMIEASNHDLGHLTGVPYDNHQASHGKDKSTETGALAREQIRIVQSFYMSKVARLVEKLSAVDGATGRRFIDDTLIVGTNEMGVWNHRTWSVPCFTISGLPQVNSGWYVDYRTKNSIPTLFVSDETDTGAEFFGRDYNSFLIGAMRAMGLGPEDWETGGVAGFGSYQFLKTTWYSETDRTRGIITPGRRAALPFMLKA
ncbi:MAG TPA: DUF1552 domain-containing protein [Bdellovibrionales bacterium]|nr:DUF1552 domain-containing protein [Bdellovibrionales bacterium]